MEWYHYIKIKGLDTPIPQAGEGETPIDPDHYECFQGISSSVSSTGGGNTLETITPGVSPLVDSPMLDTTWSLQNAKIEQQSKVMEDLKKTYNGKHGKLPRAFSVSSFLQSSIGQFLVGKLYDWVLDRIPGEVDDMIAKEVIQFGAGLIGQGLEMLSWLYTAGGELCDKMIAENTDLLTWENSRDNYKLRLNVLDSHELALQTLMTEILNAENQAQISSSSMVDGLDELTDVLDKRLGRGGLIEGLFTHSLGDLPDIMEEQMESLQEGMTKFFEDFRKAFLLAGTPDLNGDITYKGFLHDDLTNAFLIPIKNGSGGILGYRSILQMASLLPEHNNDGTIKRDPLGNVIYKSIDRDAFLSPLLNQDGVEVRDDAGNVIYKGFLKDLLLDMLYQEDTVDYPSGVRMHESSKILEYPG